MFFTPDLLCKSGGKFAVIWLAAMKKSRLKRKDFESVDLPEVCKELEKLLTPTWRGKMATVEGFSLRLSAQLVHGISVVYNMKVTFLYKDANKAFQTLHRKIYTYDLYPINLPESLANKKSKNEKDGVVDELLTVDPLFGQPLFIDPISPSLLAMPPSSFLDENLPEAVISEGDMQRNVVQDMSTITLKDAGETITLQEEEPKLPEEIDEQIKTVEELELLLPDQDPNQLGLFTTDQDQQLFLEKDNLATPKTSTYKTPERPSKKKKDSSISEDAEKETEPVANNQEEYAEKDVENQTIPPPPQPLSPQQQILSPQMQSKDDELLLGPTPTPQIKKKSKKKNGAPKLLIDENVQLSTEDMKERMRTPIVGFDDDQFLPPIHLPSAKELFNYPSHWHPVHAPGRNNHFHKGLHGNDEGEIPYLEIYRNNCEFTDDVIEEEALEKADDVTKEMSAHTSNDFEKEFPVVPPEDEIVAAEAIAEAKAAQALIAEAEERANLEDLSFNKSKASSIEDPLLKDESSLMQQRSNRDSSMHHQSRISNISYDKNNRTGDDQNLNEPTSFVNPDVPPAYPSPPRFEEEAPREIEGHPNIASKVESELAKGNRDLLFSTLVPPYSTDRTTAARCFFDILMMSKMEKVKLKQEDDFSEIEIIPFNS